MTNPAVEALKPFLRHSPSCELQYSGARSEDCNCGLNRAIAQAEQTPVGGDVVESLAKFLNEISQTDIHFDSASKKIQDAYRNKAICILEWVSDQAPIEMSSAVKPSPPPSGANSPRRESGRWVSEETLERLLRWLHEKARKSIDAGFFENALRAAPSFPKEE